MGTGVEGSNCEHSQLAPRRSVPDRRVRKWGTAFASLGAFLLALNLFGFWMAPVGNQPIGLVQVPGYEFRRLTPQQARSAFKDLKIKSSVLSQRDRAARLHQLISDSFLHTDRFELRVADNWLQWAAGVLYRPAWDPQDGDVLWRRGGGLCHQAAALYVSKARELGLQARLVGLRGHVVAEVLTELGWNVVDPDMKVYWDRPLEDFGSRLSQKEIEAVIASVGHGPLAARHFAQIYASAEDNHRIEFPSAPRRYAAERIAGWLKWIIPVTLVLVPLNASRKHRRLGDGRR